MSDPEYSETEPTRKDVPFMYEAFFTHLTDPFWRTEEIVRWEDYESHKRWLTDGQRKSIVTKCRWRPLKKYYQKFNIGSRVKIRADYHWGGGKEAIIFASYEDQYGGGNGEDNKWRTRPFAYTLYILNKNDDVIDGGSWFSENILEEIESDVNENLRILTNNDTDLNIGHSKCNGLIKKMLRMII